MAATADPLLGTEVRRFKLVRLIGRGGMGRVYEGVREDIGSRVAIKVIAEQYAHDADVAERFFAEARAVNMIRHDGIVNIYDLERLPDGRPVIVMEYVEGETLRQAMRAGPLPLGGVVVVVAQVLDALAAAHAIGVVHRDLKPDNIMIMPSGRTKVLDFGVAKLLRAPDGVATPRTRTGVVVGTPEYMAPEQIDEGLADARSDIYAMGIVLYEAIAGRRPFDGPSDYAIMRAQVEQPLPCVREVRAEVPEQLERVIVTALAKRSQDRFRSARAMSQALSHAVLALPESQWRALIPDGVVDRNAVSIPPGEPGPGESLPTAPHARGIDDVPTISDKPDALHSKHHTVDVVRPRASRTDGAAPRADGGAPTKVAVPTAPRRRRMRASAFGAIGLAAVIAAVIAWRMRTPGESRAAIGQRVDDAAVASVNDAAVANVNDAAVASVNDVAFTSVEDAAAPEPATPVAAARPKRHDAGVTVTTDNPAKVASRPPLDAAVAPTPDAAAAPPPVVRTQTPEPPGPLSDDMRAPIPDKYRAIPGVQIDDNKQYLTAARVRLEVPFSGELAKLDVARYAATAKQLARKFEADAELLRFTAKVDRAGTALRGPTYYFASRAAMESKHGGRMQCISVSVLPNQDRAIVEIRAAFVNGCDPLQVTRVPKCRAAHVAARAPERANEWMIYYEKANWRIGGVNGGHIEVELPDDC